MKRFLLLALACLIGSELEAQIYPRNIVSVRGGLNVASMSMRADGKYIGREFRNPKIGWHIGAVDEILLLSDTPLYLDLGVMLTNKGVRYVEKSAMELEAGKTLVSCKDITQYGIGYLQFPVCVSYHFYFGDFTIQPYAGLHYEVGLWGRLVNMQKLHSDVDQSQDGTTKSVEGLFRTGIAGRSDFGLMLGVGATYQERYYVGLSWEDGFCNILKSATTSLMHHSNFRISVGYNF